MQIIDFITKMEQIKNNVYTTDRQSIYNVNDRELSISEIIMDNDGNFIYQPDAKQIINLNLYIEITDFNTNKRMAIMEKNISTNEITHATVMDEWLFNELI